MALTIMYEAGDMNGRQGNRVVLSYWGRELARPNPINLESVRALERQGRLTIILESNIAGLEAVGGKVRVNFHECELGVTH